MKIHKTNSWLELNELYEDSKFIDKPYYIRRLEKDKEIVWFGLETNWKTISGTWHILNKGNWEESDQPKYEEIYLELLKQYYTQPPDKIKIMRDTKKTLEIFQFILIGITIFCMISVLIDAALKFK